MENFFDLRPGNFLFYNVYDERRIIEFRGYIGSNLDRADFCMSGGIHTLNARYCRPIPLTANLLRYICVDTMCGVNDLENGRIQLTINSESGIRNFIPLIPMDGGENLSYETSEPVIMYLHNLQNEILGALHVDSGSIFSWERVNDFFYSER